MDLLEGAASEVEGEARVHDEGGTVDVGVHRLAEHWFIGALAHWCIGALVHGCIGALAQWWVGPGAVVSVYWWHCVGVGAQLLRDVAPRSPSAVVAAPRARVGTG